MIPLAHCTHRLRQEGRKALVPFFTALYPDPAIFTGLLQAAAAAGADLIEIGLPFSDPVADGPVIQHTSGIALAAGYTTKRFFAHMESIRGKIPVPLVVMSYLNPVLQFGFDRFAAAMSRAGLHGILFPDLPLEERPLLGDSFRRREVAVIGMAAPGGGENRLAEIAKQAEGFIYLVTRTGVTGRTPAAGETVADMAAVLRRHCGQPIYAGFGISSPAQARECAALCDGVIVGSALLERISGLDGPAAAAAAADYLGGLRHALDA